MRTYSIVAALVLIAAGKPGAAERVVTWTEALSWSLIAVADILELV